MALFRKLGCLILTFQFASCGGGDQNPCDQMRDRIQTLIEERIGYDKVDYPGIVVGVDTPACGAQVVTTGLAVVAPETPMQADHILPLASITKTFVATVIMQLVQEGSLGLDDTLDQWRNDIPNAGTITVQNLLNHTSGVVDHWSNLNCMVIWLTEPDHEWTPNELLACIQGPPALFNPGEGWEYSNTNYVLLALVVEAVTGNTMHEEIRSRILTPLGLEHTFFLPQEAVTGQRAHCYDLSEDVTEKYHPSFAWGASNMVSSAGDLLTWIRHLLAGSVLNGPTLAQMKTCIDGRYALGLSCANLPLAGRAWGHAGRDFTVATELYYAPDWDSSVVILINHTHKFDDPYWPHDTTRELFAIINEFR